MATDGLKGGYCSTDYLEILNEIFVTDCVVLNWSVVFRISYITEWWFYLSLTSQ